MRRVALLVAALLPSLVAAQGVTLDITFAQGRTSETVGAGDCGLRIPATWTVNTPVFSCSSKPLQIWLTAGSCGNTPDSDPIHQQALSGTTSGTFDVFVSDLPISAGADAGTGCGTTGIEQTFKVCGTVTIDTGLGCGTESPVVTDSQPPTITYDSLPPGAPTVTRVESLDSALLISVEVDSDTTAVIIVVTDPSGAETRVQRDTSTGTTIRIGGLTNDVTYTVTAQAVDAAGNESDVSQPMQGTPVPTCGFFCRYKEAGGTETGCSSAGSALLTICGALAGAWLARVRRRRSR